VQLTEPPQTQHFCPPEQAWPHAVQFALLGAVQVPLQQ
jgi:hypothetical protein